jgi:hypothetical protein
MPKDIVIGKTRYHMVKVVGQKKSALALAREKYLMQTKAFRLSRATWAKAKFISLNREVPMTRIIDEAVDDLFNREFPELTYSESDQAPIPTDETKLPDEES